MPRGNPLPKLAIAVDLHIHKNILSAAARDGVTAWMTPRAAAVLRAPPWQWEKQHGRFTAEAMNEARRRVPAQL
jgi:hypothetical protein